MRHVFPACLAVQQKLGFVRVQPARRGTNRHRHDQPPTYPIGAIDPSQGGTARRGAIQAPLKTRSHRATTQKAEAIDSKHYGTQQRKNFSL
jgi:hypothetical protein